MKKMKKFFVGALTAALLVVGMSVNVAAEPYERQVIGPLVSYIEAVWFDSGIGHEAGPTAGTHVVRPNELTQTFLADDEDFYFIGGIGHFGAGEWIQYTVYVEEAGAYRFDASLGSGANPGNVVVSLGAETDTLVEIGTTANTEALGWYIFNWAYVGTVDLPAGYNVIRVLMPASYPNNANFAGLRVSSEAGAADIIAAEAAAALVAAVDRAAAAVERAEAGLARTEEAAAQTDTANPMVADAEAALADAEAALAAAETYAAAGNLDGAQAASDAAFAAAAAAEAAGRDAMTAMMQAGRQPAATPPPAAPTPADTAPPADAPAPTPAPAADDDNGLPIVWIAVGVGAVIVIGGIVVFMKKS